MTAGAPGALSTREKVGYALGDAASNFFWKVHEFFILFFYTDVFGISAAAAGTMFLVARIWDAVNDPLMGIVADRTRSRHGRFRPYLLWLAVPMAIASVVAFTTPELARGKLAYAYATYILMWMVYTAINIPYSALMAVMTPRSTERAELASYRFVAAFVVNLVVLWCTLWLVRVLGEGDAKRGWQLTMAAYGSVAALLFLACFWTTRERIAPPAAQELSLRRDLHALLANRPWRYLFVLGVLVIGGFALRGSTLLFYFTYYLGDQGAFAGFMLSGGVASVIGIALVPLLTRRFGKRRPYVACMTIAALLQVPYYFLGPDRLAWIYGLNVLIGLALGPAAPLLFAMYTDADAWGEWQSGRRLTGLLMSAAMLALQLGGALGGAANGWLLEAYGYVAGQTQSARAIDGILLMVSLVPAGAGLAAALVALRYPLDDRTMAHVEAELERRRGAGEGAPPSRVTGRVAEGVPAVVLGVDVRRAGVE